MVLSEVFVFVQLQKKVVEVLSEFRMIVLHRQNEVPSALDDRRGDFFLAPHGVNADDGPFEFQHSQELGKCRDFVRLLIDRNLA